MSRPKRGDVSRRGFLKGAAAGAAAPASSRFVERPGSDFMVDVFKALGLEYAPMNPGSSFEGLHESIINYGRNTMPEQLAPAIGRALAHVKRGEPALVDVVSQPR